MLMLYWLVLTGFALAMWLTGHLLGMHGVASIGAVMFVLVGAEVMLGGLQAKDGELIERDHTTVGNEVVENQTTVSPTYANHSWTQQFASQNAVGLGVFQALIGGLLFYRQMEELSQE